MRQVLKKEVPHHYSPDEVILDSILTLTLRKTIPHLQMKLEKVIWNSLQVLKQTQMQMKLAVFYLKQFILQVVTGPKHNTLSPCFPWLMTSTVWALGLLAGPATCFSAAPSSVSYAHEVHVVQKQENRSICMLYIHA